jgi:hypothetical protein
VVAVGLPAIFRESERSCWRLIGLGWQTHRAALEVGVSTNTGQRWFREAGGMCPVAPTEPSGRYLSLAERRRSICAGRRAGARPGSPVR